MGPVDAEGPLVLDGWGAVALDVRALDDDVGALDVGVADAVADSVGDGAGAGR